MVTRILISAPNQHGGDQYPHIERQAHRVAAYHVVSPYTRFPCCLSLNIPDPRSNIVQPAGKGRHLNDLEVSFAHLVFQVMDYLLSILPNVASPSAQMLLLRARKQISNHMEKNFD